MGQWAKEGWRLPCGTEEYEPWWMDVDCYMAK